ncbi:MAG: tetratricopeptide repeat protein [Luteolibacter sp.]
MKFRPLFPILLLASQCALHGQGLSTLQENGDEALASGLWEVAELRFRECLADPTLTADEKPGIAFRLAEALIRAGKPAEAVELLNLSFVSKHPESLFWKAQAIAGMGRFAEAVEIFSQLLKEPNVPHRVEAGFSKASLQLSLGKSDGALETLSALAGDPNQEIANRARLMEVEILLDLERPADARKLKPATAEVAAGDRPLAAFLEANLLLTERRFSEAATAFQALVSQLKGQSLAHYHAAAIGLADALQAQGDSESASKSLLTFIQDHPDSPALGAMFERLQQWLPAVPTTTDPVLEQLDKWITQPEAPALGLIAPLSSNSDSTVTSVWWPNEAKTSDLLAFSLFTRAIGLHRIGTPEAKAQARLLITRLRLEYADHFLANRALYQMARWSLDSGAPDRAFALLDTLRETAKSPILRGEAAFLEARSAYQKGDTKLAIKLFDEAASALPDGASSSARLNAGIARLRSGELHGVTLIQQSGGSKDKELETDLELERALSTTPPAEAKKAIEEFIAKYPEHPRIPEARLAAADAALTSTTPDLAAARSQLDALDAKPESLSSLPPASIALARLRIADLSKDSAATIILARSIIDNYPADPAATDAALTLGRNLFETKDYNPARLVLEKLAASDSDPGRAQAAWLLAARSAALVGTVSSKEEALVLFDKAIALQGPLVSIARLEKADHLIKNMYRFAEATTFLRKWFDSMPKTDPLRLPAGLLLGQALYAQGSTSPNSLVLALEIYDQLLPYAEKHPALIHRLQYLRGLALEQLPDPKDPTKKRESQAFVAYYSVLETTTPPTEWEYFELCGFKALSLLEKAERWPAAVAIAEKIASFKGPRAEEAATRANQLQLKHFIYEDSVH